MNSSAIYDYAAREPHAMDAWCAAKTAGGYPVLGIEADDGELLAFASYGAFRGWAAYKHTVEPSVYVHHAHRGQGLGEQLLRELIRHARNQHLHVLIGGLDASTAASIGLHRKLGFQHAGTVRQAGYKFKHWLDLAFYQLILPTPDHPVDG